MLQEKIKDLLFSNNKKVKDLCTYIGITDAGLRKIYARNSCEMSTLVRIASFFNVPVSCFFDEQPQSQPTTNIGNSNNNVQVESVFADNMLKEISAQRKMAEKNNEQVDRLLSIIERMQKN